MTRLKRSMGKGMENSTFQKREGALKFFAQKTCARYWWYTAVPEVVLGVWLLASGAILMLFHEGGQLSLVGGILLLVACCILPLLSWFIVKNFVIPSGVCFAAPQRKAAPISLMLPAVFVYLLLLVFGIFYAASPYLVLGVVAGSVVLIAFSRSGQMRLMFLSAWVVVSFSCVQIQTASFDFQAVQVFGFAVLMVGFGALIFGLPTGVGLLFSLVKNIARDDGEEVLLQMAPWYTPQQIEAALESSDESQRFLAAAFLCEYAEPQVLPSLIRLIHDPNIFVGVMAQRALSSIWGPDPEEMMRWQIKHGLNKVSGKKRASFLSVEAMKAFSRERMLIERKSLAHEREVEGVLAGRVAQDPIVFNHLIDLASTANDDVDLQFIAAELLGATRMHRAYATLIQLILRGNRDLASAAAEGFKGASSAAVVHIEPLFNDSREWVRVAAVNAGLGLLNSLDKSNGQDAALARSMLRGSVYTLAHHPKPVTRATALELLAQFGMEATAEIEAACNDRFAFVRGEAVRALTLANAQAAHAHVLKALSDSRAFVRGTAINCVGYLKMTEALPIVSHMLEDRDKKVATLAQRIMFVSKSWEK